MTARAAAGTIADRVAHRQSKRESNGRYRRMAECEVCERRMGDDYYSLVIENDTVAYAVCGACMIADRALTLPQYKQFEIARRAGQRPTTALKTAKGG